METFSTGFAKDDRMSRALVTGASGFVGGHLAEALVRHGVSVRCLVRPTSHVSHLIPLGVELVHGDLATTTDWTPILADVGTVYHVAGLTCALRADDLMRVNGEGTSQLAAACAQRTPPPTMVLMSSLAAAGPASDDRPLWETDKPQPISNYGRSKRAGERAAARWAGQVPLTIVRPGIVFGPRNRDLLPVFRSIYRMRMHAVPRLRDTRISLIHVEDLVEITMLAAERGERVVPESSDEDYVGKGYYFACYADPPTYAELGRIIGRSMGRPHALLLRLPTPIPWLAAAGSELVAKARGKPDTFNLDKVREARAGSWIGTSETVRRELGFQPTLSLDQRIAETAQWYLQAGWL
jgi:nucleoside-diphosphate-sugar epimerase